MGASRGDALAVFFETFGRPGKGRAWKVSAGVVLDRWSVDPAAVEELMRQASPEDVTHLFLPACLPPQRRPFFGALRTKLPDPPFEEALELAGRLSGAHPDPRVRAVAASFRICRGRNGNSFLIHPEPVRQMYEDPDLLVKRVALRLAGFLGDQADNLDLSRIILSEEDPALLTEAIRARTVWAAPGLPEGLELWDGFACGWIPSSQVDARAWAAEEIERLRSILARRREPDLRDAASLALAGRYRSVRAGRQLAPTPIRVQGFRVHEWGVWREGNGVLIPAGKGLDDLPAFVHRATVSPARIWGERFYTPSVVFKPVVFFHAPAPLEVLFRVSFHGGMPWTWFPAATDLSESTDDFLVRGWRAPRATEHGKAGPHASALLWDRNQGPVQAASTLLTRSDLRPPWLPPEPAPPGQMLGDILPGFPDPARVIPADLREFCQIAPWIIPGHGRTSVMAGELRGMGLEWCGLRVGHPPELEAEESRVDAGSWWARLRSSGASPVAVRGERERFLFYDGAINLPGPVKVARRDAAGREILLAVRPFHEYPDEPRSVLDLWWLSDTEKGRLKTTLPLPAVFVISVEGGGGARGEVLENLLPAEESRAIPIEKLPVGRPSLIEKLEEVLTREGLTTEEARGLIGTWEKEFFDTPGLRLVTVLPRWIYHALLPAEVFPAPEEFVRVGLVWKECAPADLPIGEESLAIVRRNWDPVPWSMPGTAVDVGRAALPAGDKRPLERGADGEIVHGRGQVGRPALSADGSRLAFQVLDGDHWAVLFANLAEGTLEEVVAEDAGDRKDPGPVTLSGDGRRIGFLRGEGNRRQACVADLGSRSLLDLPSAGFPRLSGDGKKAVMIESLSEGQDSELLRFDLEASRAVTILRIDTTSPALLSTVDLSDDGQKVVFAFQESFDREIYLADLAAGTIWNVSQDPGTDDFPRLSAGGNRVFFESERTRDSDLFLADLEARTLTNLTSRPGDDRFASPDAGGKRLLYREWETGFLAWDLETGKKTPLPDTRRVWTAVLSGDGRTAALLRPRKKDPGKDPEFHLYVVDVPW